MDYLPPKNLLLPLVLLLGGIMVFYNLGNIPLSDWDESRNGINAIEMFENGDYVNLHYMGVVDHMNAKPPLLIWSMVVSYKLFGISVFSSRLPVALASLGCLFFLFQLVSLYKQPIYAFFSCLVMLAVAGFTGYHVSRTADFDIPLLFFLLGGTYYLLQYIDFSKGLCLLPAVLFFGLAFMTKGLASWILFPSIVFYLFVLKGFKFVKDYRLWLFAGGVLCFPVLWYLVLQSAELSYTKDVLGDSASQLIFKNDVWDRLISPKETYTKFESSWAEKYLYFFIYLDTRFNYWYLAFYFSLLILLRKSYQIFKTNAQSTQNNNVDNWLNAVRKDKLLLFSCCVIIVFALFFTFSHNINFWYLTPIIPFLAIFSLYGINEFKTKKPAQIIVILFVAITLINRFIIINENNQSSKVFTENELIINKAKGINIIGKFPDQSLFMHLRIMNPNTKYVEKKTTLETNELGYVEQAFYNKNKLLFANREILAENNQYYLIR